VYVTDNVEGIVPEFLMMLRGVVSPDIPLNVLVQDCKQMVLLRKFQNITRKVADKLKSLLLKTVLTLKQNGMTLKSFLEYGMLSEDKFYEKQVLCLYPTVDK
jgi:molecular chaperone HtpG